MKSDIWSRFDFACMLGYAPKKERTYEGLKECESVGLRPTVFWNVRTAYDEVVERNVRHNRAMGYPAYMSITLGHLRMVKCALELGYKRALFFEDDVRFLKDETLIEKIVKDLSEDFDVALLDWVHRNKATDEEFRAMNGAAQGHWGKFTNLRSCAAYALSEQGMRMYVQLMENPVCGAGKLKICDQFWPDMAAAGLNCQAAFPNVCVQGAGGGATDHEDMWKRYNRIGIKREDYHD